MATVAQAERIGDLVKGLGACVQVVGETDDSSSARTENVHGKSGLIDGETPYDLRSQG